MHKTQPKRMHPNQSIGGNSKFICYFCNKPITNETELGHTTVCGKVLVPCPNKCGSYIPRMNLLKHRRECVNKIIKSSGNNQQRLTSSANSSFDGRNNNNTSGVTSHYSSTLGRKPARIDQSLDIVDMFKKTQNELKNLSNKLTILETIHYDRDNQNIQTKEIETCKNVQNQQTFYLEKIQYQTQVLYEWKNKIDLMELEKLKESLIMLEKSQSDNNQQWMNLQQRLIILDKLQMDISMLSDNFAKELKISRCISKEFAEKLDEFRDVFAQENATIGALWNDQKIETDLIAKDIDSLQKLQDEQKAKYNSMIFDVKTVSQIASEATEKQEIQDREFRVLRKQFDQIKLDQEAIEDVILNKSLVSGMLNPSDSPGHFLWKISNFADKMHKAKESNCVIKSIAFYTHSYGYKIKVWLYLNGLKKWRDRYALVSISVMKGEYDQLLKWPCHIEGTISLRDLENLDMPKNFSKYISAKCKAGDEESEEPQESSSSYIFIPHTILMKETYLKEDTFFLDIKIEQNHRLLTETLL